MISSASLRNFGAAVLLTLGMTGGSPAWAATPTTPSPLPGLKEVTEAPPFSARPEDLLRVAAALPASDRFGAIQLLEEGRITCDAQGRTTSTNRYIFRLDREAALQGWGIIQTSWLPWLEDRPIIRARVINQDGKEHILDPATLGDGQVADESPDVLQDRRMVRGPLPGLKVGSVAEVEIQHRDHRAFSPSGHRRFHQLSWEVPVHRSLLVIELPKAPVPHYELSGLPEKALEKITSGDKVTLRISQELVLPRKPREPYQAWDQEPWPSLIWSTAPSWAAVAAEYHATVEAQLKGTNLKAWVQEALESTRDPKEKLARLLKKMHQQVRYVGLEFGEAAIVPRPPQETLRRGYGDCKDKSTLLVALLREAGIDAQVVLLRAGDGRDFSPKFPGLGAFNHAIVRVGGSQPIWVDPTVPEARPGVLPLADAGRNALVIAPGTKATVQLPQVTPQDNAYTELRTIRMADHGPGKVSEVTEHRGASEINFRSQFTGANPAKLKENLTNYLKNTYQTEVMDRYDLGNTLDLGTPFRLVLEGSKAANAFTSDSDARVTMNPWPLVTNLNQFLKPEDPDPDDPPPTEKAKGEIPPRRTDLQLPRPWSAEVNWIIQPPKGYASEALPEAKTLKFGPAVLTLAWTPTPDGRVEASYRFVCNQLRWSPQEVDEARKAMKAFGEESTPTVVFQQAGEAHLAAGRIKEALAEFRSLVKDQPESASPLIRLGRAQLEAGLAEASRATLRKAVALEPTNEKAHRHLGWTLEHDSVGRRFRADWDRTGAAAELSKAMGLDPSLRMARLDLAVLLGHDERGEWWYSSDMEEVTRLYREQLARGKDAGAQDHLTIALARMGRLQDARVSAQSLEGRDRHAWTLALDACLKGPKVAIQDARRTHQDPGARKTAFEDAANLLVTLRRYPEAGALAQEVVGSSENAAKYRTLAAAGARIKAFESLPVDRGTPTGALLALVKASLAKDLKPQEVLECLSPAQRPEQPSRESMLRFLDGLHHLNARYGDQRNKVLDEVFSVGEFGIEGSAATGFRVQSPRSSPFPPFLFIASQEGVCRVVAWGYQPSRLGKEALWEAERGNLAGAYAWLDRAMDLIIQPSGAEPLAGHPAGLLWTKGKQGTLAEARLAAAMLVIQGERNPSARDIVTQALGTAREPLQRAALLSCLLNRPKDGLKAQEAEGYVRELKNLFPKDYQAVLPHISLLTNTGKHQEALDLAMASRDLIGGAELRPNLESHLLLRVGRTQEALEALKAANRQGKASWNDLNSLAWLEFCVGKTTQETAEYAERSVEARRRYSNLHTLGCVLAALGRTTAAKDALTDAMPEWDEIRSIDWFARGVIAENLGETEAARTMFKRVLAQSGWAQDGGYPEDPEDPTTCQYQARKRLEALEKADSRGAR